MTRLAVTRVESMQTVQILWLNLGAPAEHLATQLLWKPAQLLVTRVIPICYWRARDVVVTERVCHIVTHQGE